jgi:hypothetical protein
MKDFLKIFQNRNFSKLFLAGFTSMMGSIIGVTAFMFYLLDKLTRLDYSNQHAVTYDYTWINCSILSKAFNNRGFTLDNRRYDPCNWNLLYIYTAKV